MKTTDRLRTLAEKNKNIDRWLIHLFQQKQRHRLMLVLGAGSSADAKVPNWKDLVQRISEAVDKRYPKEHAYLGSGLTFTSQILKNKVSREMSRDPEISADKNILRLHINQSWHEIIHEALYKDTKPLMSEILDHHPYLRSMASVALGTPYVLTFNFDDLLWEAMIHIMTVSRQSDPNKEIRQPNIIWKPQITEHPFSTTIYHINGRLPHSPLGKRSDELVFTEDSFADANVSVNTPVFEQHMYKMANATQLIVGHSLDDSSLRNILRTLRTRVPANVSYYLRFVGDDEVLSEGDMLDIFETNLDVYNLITIFATRSDFETVFHLLDMDEDSFATELRKYGCRDTRMNFYVVGAVGSGKTTTLENLRHFSTFEEWPREIPQTMYVRSDIEDSVAARAEIDEAVDRSVLLKNIRLSRQGVGFYFVDRGPVDALAFQPDPNIRSARQQQLLEMLKGRLEPGEICFLAAGGRECEARNWRRGRPPSVSGDADYFDLQQAALLEAYGLNISQTYDSSGTSAGNVAREITLKALLKDYEPWDAKNLE